MKLIQNQKAMQQTMPSRLNQGAALKGTMRMMRTGLSRRQWTLSKIDQGLAYVLKFGRNVYPDFVIDDANRDVIIRLIKYFHGDPSFAPSELVKGDLLKGILLIGVPGSGKTVLMELFTKYVQYDEMFFIAEGKRCPLCFPIVPVNLAVKNYETNGPELLEGYSKRRIVCFDDLGEEKKEAIHFGSRTNVMQYILEDRYRRNVITLATSNYTVEQLGKMYGARVHSRIYEMFNIIVLPGTDRRKDSVILKGDFRKEQANA